MVAERARGRAWFIGFRRRGARRQAVQEQRHPGKSSRMTMLHFIGFMARWWGMLIFVVLHSEGVSSFGWKTLDRRPSVITVNRLDDIDVWMNA